MKSKKRMKEKGITLIALVITIVVLIILAGVLINISLGNNGLFNKAKIAKEKYVNAQDYEDVEIAKMTNSIDGYVGGGRLTGNNIIDIGTAIIPSGTSWRKVYVEFNEQFSKTPVVITQPMQENVDVDSGDTPYGGSNQWEVDNVTTEGFYIKFYNNSAIGQVHFYWIAVSK